MESKFEKLVPRLKLCRQIHLGLFDNSSLWWHCELIPGNDVPIDSYVCPRGECIDSHGGYFVTYPAPTLTEMLDELSSRDDVWCPTIHSSAYRGYVAMCRIVDKYKQIKRAGCWVKKYDSHASSAMMKLILELGECK